jgi:hypothetical protein
MSAVGQKQTSGVAQPMSATPKSGHDRVTRRITDGRGLSVVIAHDEARLLLLDRLWRREAALISTSDGKRIISQLSF